MHENHIKIVECRRFGNMFDDICQKSSLLPNFGEQGQHAVFFFDTSEEVLQQALNSLNVTRAVDVQKLVRGKYQDNLEMLQWFPGLEIKS